MSFLWRCGAMLMIANAVMSSTGAHKRFLGWEKRQSAECSEIEDIIGSIRKSSQKLMKYIEYVRNVGAENVGRYLEEIKSYDGDVKSYEAKVMDNEVKVITVHDSRQKLHSYYENSLYLCIMMDIGDLNLGYSLPYTSMRSHAMALIRHIYNGKKDRLRKVPYVLFENDSCSLSSGYGVLRFDDHVHNKDRLFETMSVLLSSFADSIEELDMENPEMQSLSSVLKRWNEEYTRESRRNEHTSTAEEISFVWKKLVSMSDITIVAIGDITKDETDILNGMALAIRSGKCIKEEEDAELLRPNVCTSPYGIYDNELKSDVPFIHLNNGFYSDQHYVMHKGSGEGKVERVLPVVLGFFESFVKSNEFFNSNLGEIGKLNLHVFPVNPNDPENAKIFVSYHETHFWRDDNEIDWGFARAQYKEIFEKVAEHIDYICAMEPADRKKYFVEWCSSRLLRSDNPNYDQALYLMRELVFGSFNYPSKDYLRHGIDDITDEEIMDVLRKLRNPDSWSIKGEIFI
ncbi:hypothetical protein HK407_05g09150 [Ordospora pajunii]|uniref:uncharacterized protein n=1 Tax=Ordospora pajunii TaxID=3039483 RepID=UPI0029527CDA|nr:uncharacterized protein HK407_05g09150 [Ordospora pajunii]KAH9411397.1 hypothetical protein HK407_05g09150 [Ordospora pajunii]